MTTTGLETLCTAATTGEGMPPAAELLGWEALSIEPGRVRVRYTAREAFYNPMGTVQGGFLAAMLDDAMGPALFTLLAEGQHTPTLEIKVSFMRPAYAARSSPRDAWRTRDAASRSSKESCARRTASWSRQRRQRCGSEACEQ